MSGVFGGLIGLTLRRSWLALGILVSLAAGIFAWGASTGIPNDLDSAARATGLHLLALADEIPSGDDGFAMLLETAFEYAEDNSHRTEALIPNRAAILALGVILGEERVAQIARRSVNLNRSDELNALRGRITLRG